MAEAPKRIIVQALDAAAQATLEVLAKAGMITIADDSPAPSAPVGKGCALCGAIVPLALHPKHPGLGALCPLCLAATDRLHGRFQAAALKSYQEFRGQLPRMVKDVRSGNVEPTFYQGFE